MLRHETSRLDLRGDPRGACSLLPSGGRTMNPPMFRKVELPPSARGQLFLHSMPRRYESFDAVRREIVERGVVRVVCLAPVDEIHEKSPDYAAALASGVAWAHDPFPIADFSAPEDISAFRDRATSVVDGLLRGDNVLVHCAAGVGRTGTFATAVLLALGLTLDVAEEVVHAAGAGAETDEQRSVLADLARG